jgi:DNA-directed RNA polymerase specialized sigma24 family protein
MLRFGVPAADAEDAAHEVFLISCRRQVDLTGSEDRSGWLYVTARYVSLNQRRSLRRERTRRSCQPEALEGARAHASLAPDEQLAAQQLCQLLAEGVEQLSLVQRGAVCALLDGNSPADIAQEQRTPLATVSSRLQVSRQALRRHLHRRGWPVAAAPPAARRAA